LHGFSLVVIRADQFYPSNPWPISAQPDQLTVTAPDTYLKEREASGVSISHRTRIKTVVGNFARYLIKEHGVLRRNPARSVHIPPQPLYAPRVFDPDQRYILRSLVERDAAPRSAAIFALGFWAGCRVSDIAWLRMEHTHVTRKAGWLHVGHKGFVFTSQRAERLTEAGIHRWFRTLKARATKAEWELIHDIAFHDLRHDFAHRARAAGWSLEAVTFYLGHITRKGTPAIQTTVRYTQISRDDIKRQLAALRG
jgi:site-specific recombinase XerD